MMMMHAPRAAEAVRLSGTKETHRRVLQHPTSFLNGVQHHVPRYISSIANTTRLRNHSTAPGATVVRPCPPLQARRWKGVASSWVAGRKCVAHLCDAVAERLLCGRLDRPRVLWRRVVWARVLWVEEILLRAHPAPQPAASPSNRCTVPLRLRYICTVTALVSNGRLSFIHEEGIIDFYSGG